MYCAHCGFPLQEGMNFCPKCGNPAAVGAAPPAIAQASPPVYPEAGRGALILILGILALLMLGPFSGIPAWVMGAKDMKKIDQGRIAPAERTMTQVGMILGIVGTVLGLLVLGIIVVTLLLVFGILTSVAGFTNAAAVILPVCAGIGTRR
jgi:hypothetical protein